VEEAHSNLLEATDAVHALFRGEDSEDARVGALLLAEVILAWTPRRNDGR
jgi:hypothetical protein